MGTINHRNIIGGTHSLANNHMFILLSFFFPFLFIRIQFSLDRKNTESYAGTLHCTPWLFVRSCFVHAKRIYGLGEWCTSSPYCITPYAAKLTPPPPPPPPPLPPPQTHSLHILVRVRVHIYSSLACWQPVHTVRLKGTHWRGCILARRYTSHVFPLSNCMSERVCTVRPIPAYTCRSVLYIQSFVRAHVCGIRFINTQQTTIRVQQCCVLFRNVKPRHQRRKIKTGM